MSSSKSLGDGVSFGRELVGWVASVISSIFGIFGAITSMFGSSGVVIIFILVSLLAIPWVYEHDVIIEEAEHFLRAVLYPFYRTILRPIMNFVRRIYNPLICWFNAINWWAAGVITEVVYPTIKECADFDVLFTAAEEFVLAVINDFLIDYFLAQQFYNGPANFDNICAKFIVLWGHWTDLYR